VITWYFTPWPTKLERIETNVAIKHSVRVKNPVKWPPPYHFVKYKHGRGIEPVEASGYSRV